MTTDSGGWTLVWSYTFTKYTSFGATTNAVIPIPDWPASSTNIPRSKCPPTQEDSQSALKFDHWKLIGEDVLIKSNINHWVSCKPKTWNNPGYFLKWKDGNLSCRNVKNVALKCLGQKPNNLLFTIQGPIFRTTSKQGFYYFEGSTTNKWPIHDPCSSATANHKTGVASPGGNLLVR